MSEAETLRPRRARQSGIDRALQILDHLQATGVPVTAYEIARSIGAPISTVYSIIDDLVEKSLLSRVEGNAVWLGPRLYYYGLAYAASLDAFAVASEVMREFAMEVGETVQICGRDGDMMVVMGMTEGPGHFRVTSKVGTRVPLSWTASGRLLVGHLPFEERLAIFQRSARPSPTGRAETNAATLAEAAGKAFGECISVQIGESDFAVSCIAAPIRDEAGHCLMTISIVLPEQKAVQGREHYCSAVRDCAARIERRLGSAARQ
ncbi:IclR family transcriptional regulator [Consotaella salsifontis]|uniref:Transcriptional regulator, IclR family n=1 Tax=Consotaella salsifontis TaxID=1365950 RepID=A0A1T4PNY1_9HYPH|nr:IclR family transcriptional regulator [Consotaella salsifontis]SJZ93242.1 transcriptional regulator, IclR family [Consotaella salsifontis]